MLLLVDDFVVSILVGQCPATCKGQRHRKKLVIYVLEPDLPQYHSAALRSQNQCSCSIGLSSERYTVYLFRKWHHSFLITILPAIDMDDGFICLCGEDVGEANRQAVGVRRTLLE